MPAPKQAPQTRSKSVAKKSPHHSAASFDFEKSLAELEKIVQRMERGEQTLQQTLDDFERGMVLAEQCQKNLESAQQRVDVLVQKHGAYQLQALDSFADGAEPED